MGDLEVLHFAGSSLVLVTALEWKEAGTRLLCEPGKQ